MVIARPPPPPQAHCFFFVVITARVAKRAKVIISQVCVTSTPGGRWATPGHRSQHLPPSFPPLGTGHNTSLPPPWAQVTTPSSPLGTGHNTSPPWAQVTTPPSPNGHMSQHLPPSPPGPGYNTSLPPGYRSQHLPPPWARVTTPPSLPPGDRSQHLPPPPGTRLQHLPPPHGYRSQHLPPFLPPPLGTGHNTSLPPPLGTGHNTSLPPSLPPGHRSQHLPPSPRAQVTTPPSPPPGLCAGGRYASYWNAFLFTYVKIMKMLKKKASSAIRLSDCEVIPQAAVQVMVVLDFFCAPLYTDELTICCKAHPSKWVTVIWSSYNKMNLSRKETNRIWGGRGSSTQCTTYVLPRIKSSWALCYPSAQGED